MIDEDVWVSVGYWNGLRLCFLANVIFGDIFEMDWVLGLKIVYSWRSCIEIPRCALR